MAAEGVFVDACGVERDVSGEFTVTFTGFKTLAHAQEFVRWYDGAGEQDAYEWMGDHAGATYNTSGKRTEIDGSNVICSLCHRPCSGG